MLDAGLVMFAGLFIIWFWRLLCPWRCFGMWLQYANYNILLYALTFFLLVYSLIMFLIQAMSGSGKDVWGALHWWMKPLIVMSLPVVVLTFITCFVQSGLHVDQIRGGAAALKHDRAVQIIALPAVYGTMALCCLVRVYLCMSQEGPNIVTDEEVPSNLGGDGWAGQIFGDQAATPETRAQQALSRGETCFYVADLYEAWALYQFAKLSLEMLAANIAEKEASPKKEDRIFARALAQSHSTIEALAWLGVVLFLVVCLTQAGWSIYLLSFAEKTTYEKYEGHMDLFTAAGVVASAASVYNITIIETYFHHELDHFAPFMKFITVKILVTFAFLQKGAFSLLCLLEDTLPDFLQIIIQKIPFLGVIVGFTPVQFEFFYSALLILECGFVAALHLFAWKAKEDWYGAQAESEEPSASERTPLLR